MLDKIYISDISKFLDRNFIGRDIFISKPCSISTLQNNHVSFVNQQSYKINQTKEVLIIAIEGFKIDKNSKCTFIFTSNPRLDFIKVMNEFFFEKKTPNISETSKIGKNCLIGKEVSIGEYCIIGDNVKIGDNTILKNHVLIEDDTIIGNNCYIKSGAIIGEEGFGFERDANNKPIRFPHIGNVRIENNVEIGANTIISRATLDETIIKSNVKIDDVVFIAHNVIIEENTMVVACSEISGGVKIGRNCWIGPNSTIKDGIIIEDNVFLGLGCSITNNVKAKSKLGTLTNLSLRNIVKLNKFLSSN